MMTDMQAVLKKNEKDVVIFADTGEMTTKVAAILLNRCKLRTKRLHIGDYVVSKRIVVERKVSEDFLQSIVDGRLFRQINGMKKYEKPLIIIEGNHLMDNDRNIHPNAVRGAIASISTDFAIPIIWTKNQLETAEMLLTLAKREQIGKKASIAVRTKKRVRSANELQEFIVAGLPGISTKTAKKLLKHFGYLERIFSASDSDLMKVEGIGKVLAKRIRHILTKRYEKSILE